MAIIRNKKSKTKDREEAPSTPSPEQSEIINNRYRVIRKLGRGGMGMVFLVEDQWKDGLLLALKRVRKDRIDHRTITILRNEFLALSSARHPNLAKVYDFEVDLSTQDFFFTSEYVDGAQLLKASRDLQIGRRGELLRLLSALVQILRALEFIHSRGMVHGDIKPENILITGSLCGDENGESSSEDFAQVKLIDFGLIKREKEFSGKKIIGTTYYIAPETILGSQIDRRTDLYSLGVLLYHIVTHQLPFTGDSNLAVMRGHIEKDPQPPHIVEPQVPEALSHIILRLMEKTPAERYGSALEIIEAINQEFSTDFPFETSDTRLSYIQSGGFIGREPEMSELAALFDTVYKAIDQPSEGDEDLNISSLSALPSVVALEHPPPPPGRLVLIRGESGVGKRRLLDEFRRHVQTRGVHYIELFCHSDDTERNQVFINLVRAVVSTLSIRSPEDQPDQTSLESFFKTVERASKEKRSLGTVVDKLVQKLLDSSRTTPIFLAFQGLQRADAATQQLLLALIERLSAGVIPDAQLMMVATVEDDDPEDAGLRPLLTISHIRSSIRIMPLRRFDADEISRLLESMFGGTNPFQEQFLHLIQEESDGNPGVVREILEFLVSRNQIQRLLTGWISEGDVERDSIPGKVRHELRRRIEGLDSAAQRLALAFSILGSSGELEVAVRLSGIQPGQIFNAIWVLKQEKILREEVVSDELTQYSFIHSSAREILYHGLTADQRAEAHGRAGLLLEAHLEASGRRDPRCLAFHFLRSHNAAAALHHGMEAAQEYERLYNPRKAIDVYGEVCRVAGVQDPGSVWEIERTIARLHTLMGEYRNAAEILRKLVTGNSLIRAGQQPSAELPPAERASTCVELGKALCYLGGLREAVAWLNEALGLLKGIGSADELGSLLLRYTEFFLLKGNYDESLRYCERVLSWEQGIQKVELKTQLYQLLAENHFRLDNKEIAVKYCQKGLELLESKRDVGHLALTLLYLGKFYKYKGRFQKAIKQFQICSMVNQKIGAVDRQADCLMEMGEIYLLLDNPEEAQNYLSQAISIYDRTGNISNIVQGLILRGEAHRILGHYEDSSKDIQKAIQLNTAIGNMQHSSECHLTLGKAAIDGGKLKRADEYLTEAARFDKTELDERWTLKILSLRCGMELERGNFKEALDLAARGIIAGREVGNRIRMATLLVHRMRLYLILGKKDEARRSLATLTDLGNRYGLPVVEGRALLMEGMLHVVEGKKDDAKRAFQEALEIFREWRSERDLINVYLEYGLLQLSENNYEQAYLLLEEGLYLSKKLDLAYPRCRMYHAMGLLESSLSESDSARAEGYFLTAERYARGASLSDNLWRIRFDLGKFYLATGEVTKASRTLSEAVKALSSQLKKIPESFRDTYRTATGADDLVKLQDEVKARAEVEAQKERLQYPNRNPEGDHYFDLVGRSACMKELFKTLAALPPDLPWVWIWGEPDSGRQKVAVAIHKQSVPEKGEFWVYPAINIYEKNLNEFLAKLEEARGFSPGRHESKRKSNRKDLTLPARYSLILKNFQEMDVEIQKFFKDLVLGEKDDPDGLRVIATLDRPLERFLCPEGQPQEAQGLVIPELLTQNFPEIRVPSLGERSEDLQLLMEYFLQEGRKPEEGAAPKLTAEGMDMIRKLPFLKQVGDIRTLCEKICRFGGVDESIGPEAIRTILTPTLKIARQK